MDREQKLRWLGEAHRRNCDEFVANAERVLRGDNHPTFQASLIKRIRFLLVENQERAERIAALVLPSEPIPPDEAGEHEVPVEPLG